MNEKIREIAFDTETTGLNANDGDRIIELGAVELENHIPTGRTFRVLINPGMNVSADTIRITGITDDDLVDKPPFEHPDIVDAFLDFIGDGKLVAHNASFDRAFLNMELERCGKSVITEDRWVDTLAIARKRFPGAPSSLDALCKRFEISLESRTFHGALLDSQLLASVYLELLGGRARSFEFSDPKLAALRESRPLAAQRPSPLPSLVTAEEKKAHDALLAELGENSIWAKIG